MIINVCIQDLENITKILNYEQQMNHPVDYEYVTDKDGHVIGYIDDIKYHQDCAIVSFDTKDDSITLDGSEHLELDKKSSMVTLHI